MSFSLVSCKPGFRRSAAGELYRALVPEGDYAYVVVMREFSPGSPPDCP